MVFKAAFNNISVISWWSALLVEETGELVENHWPATSHWQTLSLKDWSQFLFGSWRNNLNQVVHNV